MKDFTGFMYFTNKSNILHCIFVFIILGNRCFCYTSENFFNQSRNLQSHVPRSIIYDILNLKHSPYLEKYNTETKNFLNKKPAEPYENEGVQIPKIFFKRNPSQNLKYNAVAFNVNPEGSIMEKNVGGFDGKIIKKDRKDICDELKNLNSSFIHSYMSYKSLQKRLAKAMQDYFRDAQLINVEEIKCSNKNISSNTEGPIKNDDMDVENFPRKRNPANLNNREKSSRIAKNNIITKYNKKREKLTSKLGSRLKGMKDISVLRDNERNGEQFHHRSKSKKRSAIFSPRNFPLFFPPLCVKGGQCADEDYEYYEKGNSGGKQYNVLKQNLIDDFGNLNKNIQMLTEGFEKMNDILQKVNEAKRKTMRNNKTEKANLKASRPQTIERLEDTMIIHPGVILKDALRNEISKWEGNYDIIIQKKLPKAKHFNLSSNVNHDKVNDASKNQYEKSNVENSSLKNKNISNINITHLQLLSDSKLKHLGDAVKFELSHARSRNITMKISSDHMKQPQATQRISDNVEHKHEKQSRIRKRSIDFDYSDESESHSMVDNLGNSIKEPENYDQWNNEGNYDQEIISDDSGFYRKSHSANSDEQRSDYDPNGFKELDQGSHVDNYYPMEENENILFPMYDINSNSYIRQKRDERNPKRPKLTNNQKNLKLHPNMERLRLSSNANNGSLADRSNSHIISLVFWILYYLWIH